MVMSRVVLLSMVIIPEVLPWTVVVSTDQQ